MQSTSSNPLLDDADKRCAEAIKPIPPPRKCGQKLIPVETILFDKEMHFVNPPHFAKSGCKIENKLNSMKKYDIPHSLIVVAEAVKKEDGSRVVHKYMDGEQRLGGIGDYISQELMKKTDVECRVTSLGHVQRGAPPTASDRILASAFGVYAVDLLNQKKFDRMVAWRDRRVVDVPIDEGIKTYKNVERKDSLVETALSLGIYLGDDI